MTVYVITQKVTNEVVGVFNSNNGNDILAGVLLSLYSHNYCEEDPELISDFVALWMEKDIECLDEFGFAYDIKILNDPTHFEDF
jgi:hypothetical protein